MQKLEEIMRAEEAARHTVASARERADDIIRQAEADAATTLAQGRAEAMAEARRLRDSLVAEAQAKAAVIGSESAESRECLTAEAGGRLAEAVEAALGELAG